MVQVEKPATKRGRGVQSSHSAEQKVRIVFEVMHGKEGRTIKEICKSHGIADVTYYEWRKKIDPSDVNNYDSYMGDLYKALYTEMFSQGDEWLYKTFGAYDRTTEAIANTADQVKDQEIEKIDSYLFGHIVQWNIHFADMMMALKDMEQTAQMVRNQPGQKVVPLHFKQSS